MYPRRRKREEFGEYHIVRIFIIRTNKSGTRMGGKCRAHGEINAYKIPVTKPEGKLPLGRPRHRLEDNTKTDPDK